MGSTEVGRILIGPHWDGGILNEAFKEEEGWTMAKSFLFRRIF